jgi:hypothetical protein
MLVAVLSRAGQAFSHAVNGFSLAPGSMLLRLRRASLGLLFVVCAVGFGLVLFIAQLGWPGAFRSPIPGTPEARVGSVHDAVALAGPGPSRSTAPADVGANARHSARGLKRSGSRPAGKSHLGGSHELNGATGKGPGVDQPTSHVPAQPAGEPASPVPAPTAPVTAAVETAPQAVTPAPSSPKSKTGETAAAKIASDEVSKPVGTTSKSQGKSTKDKSTAPVAAKPSQQQVAKVRKDESTAAKAPPAQPAAPATPAASKEAADAAGAD